MAQEPTTRPAARRRTRAAIASVNLRLVRKIIEDVAPSALASLPDEALTDQEREIVSFVRGHYQAHGRFPSPVTLEERRIILPEAPEPLAFYQQAAENAIKVRVVAEAMLAAQEALNNNEGDDALAALRVAYEPVTSTQIRTLRDRMEMLRETMRPRNSVQHTTPFSVPVLDQHLGGISAGDLAVLYGRPASGKTMLQLASVLGVARTNEPVLVISKEMTEPQIAHRLAALNFDFDPRHGLQVPLSTRGYNQIMERIDAGMMDRIMSQIIIPDATRVRHPDDIGELIRQTQPRIVALDGAYFMKARRSYGTQRENFEELVRGIKQVAFETNTGFLMTWQQNRGKGAVGTDGIYGTDSLSQDAATAIELSAVVGYPNIRRGKVTKNRHGPQEITFGFSYEFKPTRLGEPCDLPRTARDARGGNEGDAIAYAERTIRAQRERP